MSATKKIEKAPYGESPSMTCYPSSFGPGCRVKVVSISTYKGRYGTITQANGMPDRWFVAIDDESRFESISFYAIELADIPLANAEPMRGDNGTNLK